MTERKIKFTENDIQQMVLSDEIKEDMIGIVSKINAGEIKGEGLRIAESKLLYWISLSDAKKRGLVCNVNAYEEFIASQFGK